LRLSGLQALQSILGRDPYLPYLAPGFFDFMLSGRFLQQPGKILARV